MDVLDPGKQELIASYLQWMAYPLFTGRLFILRNQYRELSCLNCTAQLTFIGK